MVLRILVLWLCLCYSYSKASCLIDETGLCTPGVTVTEDTQVDITEQDLTNALLDWDMGSLEASVVNAIGITGEMEHEIKNWTKKWNTLERVNIQQKKREYDNWIKSSVLVANKLAGSRYIDKSGYTFFRQDSFPEYKDRAYSFAQDIKKNTNNSVMKAVYNASVGSGWKDKWNPSDILAVKSAVPPTL